MPETIIESVLTGKVPLDVLVRWLNVDSEEETPEDCEEFCCSRKEFVAYFLTYLRNQTDGILKPKSPHCQHQSTPKKVLNSKRKQKLSVSEPTSELENDRNDSLTVKYERQRSQSPNNDRNSRKPRKSKTKLFVNSSYNSSRTDSDESRLSTGAISSTPLKNGMNASEYQNMSTASPVTPSPRSVSTREGYERCDTPRTSRYTKSQDKSFSLGDYIVNAQSAKSKDKRKRITPRNVSKDLESSSSHTSLDLSNSEMFPEIGFRKSSSEKRRIKPTNIDCTPQKSYSMNSFNSESFQQPSPLALEENIAFRQEKLQLKELSNGFDAERSMLKQERHKLIEKFNVINISTSPKSPLTPTIKVMGRDFAEKKLNYITVELTKGTLKEKIDLLVEIYQVLINKNYVLSVSCEIYFLISILLSKQYEEESTEQSETNLQNLLKSIHNSIYFAVKSLWFQRHILEIILDKNTLKLLGENKHVRSFYPELAKFLLNLYGLKCEIENQQKDEKSSNVLDNRFANGMVCFNLETDNADNFPSVLSFQNFKKQRDMFYEILRWYNACQPTGAVKTTFRGRVKTLLSLSVSPENFAHLARLYTTHMLAECLPANEQESKLSKLQRRLTAPVSQNNHRTPSFTAKEMFYKEFVIYAENEMFRVHLKDCLIYEICQLNESSIGSTDERGGSSELTKAYLTLSQKLRLLSKFLGFISDLPYNSVPIDYMLKAGVWNGGKVGKRVDTFSGIRDCNQPTIDLIALVQECIVKGRLTLTLPWIVHYLAMLYFTTLRTKYYRKLIEILLEIYTQKLRINEKDIYKTTKVYLRLILGWLFDLPEFPQEIFYENYKKIKMADSVASEENIDSILVVNEVILCEMCPFLKDIYVLLSSSKPIQDTNVSFRHITPVTIVNPEEKVKNKEKEVQARLAEALLKSQPSSTRRVIELVIERVTSACVKQITNLVNEYRIKSRNLVVEAANKKYEANELLSTMKSIYSSQLTSLQSESYEMAKKCVNSRTSNALQSLLPSGNNRAPLEAVASRTVMENVSRWISQHCYSTSILCKDIEEEMRNLLVTSELLQQKDNNKNNNPDNLLLPNEEFEKLNLSPTAVIIEIKEQICLLLENENQTSDLNSLLIKCHNVVSLDNVFSKQPVRNVVCTLVSTLCLVIVSRKPKNLDEEFLRNCDLIWNECCPNRKRQNVDESLEPVRRPELSPDLRNFEEERIPTPVSDDDTTEKPIKIIINTEIPTRKPDESSKNCSKVLNISKSIYETSKNCSQMLKNSVDSPKNKNDTRIEETEFLLDHFNRVLCPRNIVLLSDSKCKQNEVWETLASFLVFLMKNAYLSEDSLTEQCLAVYRQEWPQSVLESLSLCMRCVSSKWTNSGGKFNLFLDFLSEFCGDMDFESFDLG